MLSLLRTNTFAAAAARRTFSTSQARADVARITLVGRLATEPEIAQLSDGREVMRYVIGVSKGTKGVSWFRVANFDLEGRGGKEYLASMPKGTQVFFEGDINLSVRELEDGKKFTEHNIYQHSIKALRRPKERTAEEAAEE
ncbi:uncharacterized protein LAJ45_07899 [Morchella importuna]|uniref:Nucleic acid-binding protein n=1 Tax=Morchella conica CCBAS932 TaxID=1392247 RepID=A0A3N4KDL7_9PEZI|nr:uncharacterized protein LAJ45_07899 [Morchella importuna]KAH8148135.1 hypothetical protein LAJ45_07899 [Morchella importuna]RPB07578.1 hypothetical protein P167DRAFT_579100 [Morchella conica CCBAS932]